MTARHTRRPPGRPRDPGLEQRRRTEILEVAGRMFAELGYARTDLQQLADRIGIGKGTIYRYFPSKRDLFLSAVDSGLKELNREIERHLNWHEGPVVIKNCIRAYLAFFDRNPHMVELFIQERSEFRDQKVSVYFESSNENYHRHLQWVEEMIHRGYLRDIPPQRILDVVADLLYGTIFANYLSGRSVAFDEQANEIIDIIFYGILNRQSTSENEGKY